MKFFLKKLNGCGEAIGSMLFVEKYVYGTYVKVAVSHLWALKENNQFFSSYTIYGIEINVG